ncbi:hypothetical protein D6779_09605, partial [Candidatus Parcubacteria bacterium]
AREQFWIDRLDSYQKGFNARPKAESFYGMKWTKAQNAAQSLSNRRTWADSRLRSRLSKRFRGVKRGKWTVESHKKVSEALKHYHQENPNLRWEFRDLISTPEIEEKRINGVRRSLRNPEIYNARILQLRAASQSPLRIKNLRKRYFEKFDRKSLGVKSSEELDRLCKEMYEKGSSLRDIGRAIGMDHKSVASRLRRAGVEIKKRPKCGSRLPFAKLNEGKVEEIRQLLREGQTNASIAAKFGVSPSVISEIKTGKAWKHTA